MLRALCPWLHATRGGGQAHHVLGLCAPQWFGAGDLEEDARDAVARGATMGFQVLQRELGRYAAMQSKVVEIDHREPVGAGKVKYHSALSKVALQMSQQLHTAQPEQVFTIGGDCSVDLAPMSYLRQRYGLRMLVAYIDAHADLNAEWETPSGHFHGMSLRAMLGEAPKDLAPAVALEPSRLVLLGARDLDPAEQKFIEEKEVRMLSSSELKDLAPETAAQALETVAQSREASLLHIHLDLDVLDPAEFPHECSIARRAECDAAPAALALHLPPIPRTPLRPDGDGVPAQGHGGRDSALPSVDQQLLGPRRLGRGFAALAAMFPGGPAPGSGGGPPLCRHGVWERPQTVPRQAARRTAAVASTLVVAAGTTLRRRTGHCARTAVAGGDAVTTLEPTGPGERQAPPTGELQGDVFLVQTPLTLPPPVPAGLANILPKHSVVLASLSDGGYAAFDFVPAAPEDPVAALQLLLGGSVDGLLGLRRLQRLPRQALRLGKVKQLRVEEVIAGVNNTFDKQLSLTSNDCNNYSQAVLKAILQDPEKMVQERLFSTLDWDGMATSEKVEYKEPSVLNAIVLVAGTTVGAGILALPAVTQPAGFIPSTVALTGAWMYMATTGLFIAEVACKTMATTGKPATSLKSMAAGSVGPTGAWLTSAAFVFLHMALLIAYCSRGGELLTSLLPLGSLGVPPPLAFAGLFGGFIFVTKGTDALDQGNNIFATIVVASFFALVALVIPAGDLGQLFSASNWSQATDTIPTLLLSLVYHNVVPTVCAQLEGDRNKITKAVVVGSLIPFLMFVIWNGAVLAALPGATTGSADPLEVLRSSGSPLVAGGILAFSLSAIVTSFVGFVVALTDFFADFLGGEDTSSMGPGFSLAKLRDFALTLVPPVLVAVWDPSLFFQAIDQAGAFGVSTLFGLLPALMVLSQRSNESPVLTRNPEFLGGYKRGPILPGPLLPLLVAAVALWVVGDNALELLPWGL
eukprot:s748_g6.t1